MSKGHKVADVVAILGSIDIVLGEVDRQMHIMFTLIRNGLVYAPEPLGKKDMLLVNDKVIQIGNVDELALSALNVDLEVIDATDCLVIPGLIDPHEHLIGAGGEEGFTSRMPEIAVERLIESGITTVVGLLGTDTTTRHLTCLHAKVKQIKDEGLSAYMYTGGFEIPPSKFFDRLTDDLVFINEVIGTGEIAISDSRWVNPPLYELAKVVSETMLGGKMSAKAGITHFHVGERQGRLSLLHQLVDEYDIPIQYLYPTHITRSPELLKDAIKLAKRGAYVDMDIIEENLADCLHAYQEGGGPMDKLTVSSDAHTDGGSPEKLSRQLVDCVLEYNFTLEEILPCFTQNTAQVLSLKSKGRLAAGIDADALVLDPKSLEILHVFANGQHLMKDNTLVKRPQQTQQVEESLPT
jgi:beta-aspartyl-dipeptidase (metallo-type)